MITPVSKRRTTIQTRTSILNETSHVTISRTTYVLKNLYERTKPSPKLERIRYNSFCTESISDGKIDPEVLFVCTSHTPQYLGSVRVQSTRRQLTSGYLHSYLRTSIISDLNTLPNNTS